METDIEVQFRANIVAMREAFAKMANQLTSFGKACTQIADRIDEQRCKAFVRRIRAEFPNV